MPNYEFHCEQCDTTTEAQYKIAEKPESITCECGGTAKFRLSAPAVMGTALPDGTKRKGFADLREASKLNRAMAVEQKPETKKAMAQEIRKLGVKVTQ